MASGRLHATLSLQTNADRTAAYEGISAVLRAAVHSELPNYLSKLAEGLDVSLREEGARRGYALMDWDQLRELNGQGFEIGGHTATHCNLVDVTEETLQMEVASSIATIECQLATPVLTFAYPYGRFQQPDNSAAAKVLQTAGCRAAFTCVNAAVEGSANNPLELPRSRLNRSYPFACAFNIQAMLNNTS